MNFRGLSAFPVTPVRQDGTIEMDTLRHLLDRMIEAGVDSIGLLGSTGGYAYLAPDDRRAVAEAAVSHVDGRVPIMVGVGAMDTGTACALAGHAAEAGADGLFMAPVSYTPLTDEEVFRHYETVAGTTPLPLCIYNNPGTTHFTFSHDLIARLAALPAISAVKMPLPAEGTVAAELDTLRPRVPEEFAIGYSGDWGCTPALLDGADAWYSVLGGILPEEARAIVDAVNAGERDRAREIARSFDPLLQLFRQYGSIRVVYAMLTILGISEVAPPRPLLPLVSDEFRNVARALDATRSTLVAG